jgi:large subunit ribosomal protein L10
MKKIEKSLFVENLSEELKSATSIIFVDYTGLSVKKQQNLKKRLKEVNAKMFVAKNTLFKIAGTNAKIAKETLEDTVLSGPTAYILTSEDPLAPIQILAKFAKEFEVPSFKVAVVDGKFQDKESLIKLSQLPSKEVLYAQVVGAVGSPIYGLLATLQGNMQKLIYILNQASTRS